MNIPSPCTGVCKLDGQNLCMGCFRTLDEIARWTQMSAAEQLLAVGALGRRRNNLRGDGTKPLPSQSKVM